MDFIKFCINNPTKVTVGVLLLILAGILSLFAIPVQLTPDVDRPIITIETNWTGRSPEEVERSVIEEQEEKLKGVTSLKKMTAEATLGKGKIQLEFYIGTDMRRAIQEVSDKLREVPSYPDDVDQPVIIASASALESPITWMILDHPDKSVDVQKLYDEIDRQVKPILERVEGVSQINIYGGRLREAHIQFDPALMAQRGIDFNDLIGALRAENVNSSAGEIASGRLDVRVRTLGQYDNTEDILETIVAYTDGGPVRVRDVATAEVTYEKRRYFVRANGQEGMAINAIRETGANVMQTMAGLRDRVDYINKEILPAIQPGLRIRTVYDETVYITDAISLVLDNLWQGGVFAIVVLLLFLGGTGARRVLYVVLPVMLVSVALAMFVGDGAVHKWSLVVLLISVIVGLIACRPAAIISVAIPVSVIGTFTVLTLLGRNLNVVSLAGLAFAVGMVVDNAIVVLENIDRHVSMGKSPKRAAYDATSEVWLALIASTSTTLIVFVPVLAIQDIAGQLFRDIALAICAAVSLSLIVSITVIPAAAAHFLKPHKKGEAAFFKSSVPEPVAHTPEPDMTYGESTAVPPPAQPKIVTVKDLSPFKQPLTFINTLIADAIYWCAGNNFVAWMTRVVIVGLIATASLVLSYKLMPPITYLPSGNMNLVFGIMVTPPSYSLKENELIAERVELGVRPHWEARTEEEVAALPPVFDFMTQQTSASPGIDNYFFVPFGGIVFMGGTSKDKSNVQPLTSILNNAMATVPGSFGFAMQQSIFGRGDGGSNSISIEITGTDLNQIRNSAGIIFGSLMQKYGPFAARPSPPNFSTQGPELQVRANNVRAAELGISNRELGDGVQSLVDGLKIGDYRHKGQSIDLKIIRTPDYVMDVESMKNVPVVVTERDGSRSVVPLESITELAIGDSPQQINRIEQLRAVTIIFSVPKEVPLEQATTDLIKMVNQLRDAQMIPPGVRVDMAGNADDLARIRAELLGTWTGFNAESFRSMLSSRLILAILINYLLMAALFESWVYPFVIMFSVPLAAVGGFMGLAIVHAYNPSQLLDVVTMLGFIILVGTAVNNAILIVAQALNFMKGFGESESDKVEKLSARMAIRESVRTRMRPVMMTTLTTIFGLVPLVVMPGSGSELYRGLGAVVLGGLLLSTFFTLILVPLLFSIVIETKIAFYRYMKWPVPELGEDEVVE